MDKYEEALERAREWEREHPNGYVIRDMMEFIFPGYNESEDEQARQFLLAVADNNLDILRSLKTETYIGSKGLRMVADDIKDWENARAWLEKQKEQKPAEKSEKPIISGWSEEDELMGSACIAFIQDEKFKGYERSYECVDWLKDLPNRISSQPHWKPSEEQMEAFFKATPVNLMPDELRVYHSLCNDLKKL